MAALFCVLAAVVTGREDKAVAWFTLAASSFFVFNPGGYQVMLWGLPPVYSLLSLAFFIGVYVAQLKLPTGVKVTVAGLVCLFASFVLGNGLLFWIALPAVLLLYEQPERLRENRGALSVFSILLCLAIAGYTLGFTTQPGSSPSAGSGWNPIEIGLFFLALTGNFVSLSMTPQPVHLAQAAGALTLLTFAIATPIAIRARTGRRRVALIWAMFGLFWLLSGLLAAIGRRAFGVGYALDASRYVTESSFFLLATLTLALIALRGSGARLRPFLLPAVALLLLAGIVCRFPQTGTANALMENSRYSQLLGKTAAEGAAWIASPAFRNIFPRTSFTEFAGDVKFLNSRGWLRPALWDEHFIRRLTELAPNSFCGSLDSITRAGDTLNLLGWAYLPNRSERAHAVIIAGFETGQQLPAILGLTSAGRERPDVAAALHLPDAGSTGWTLNVPLPETSDRRQHLLKAFAYDAETGEVCALAGARLAP